MYFGSQEYVCVKRSALSALSDDCLVLAVISWIYGIVDNHLENEYSLILRLPKPCQDIYGAVLADDDARNGGFAQYFTNEADFADIAMIGFDAVGAQKESKIMSKATAMYNTIENFDDNTFERFDDEYCHSCDSEMFENLCIKYIRENIIYFGEQG